MIVRRAVASCSISSSLRFSSLADISNMLAALHFPGLPPWISERISGSNQMIPSLSWNRYSRLACPTFCHLRLLKKFCALFFAWYFLWRSVGILPKCRRWIHSSLPCCPSSSCFWTPARTPMASPVTSLTYFMHCSRVLLSHLPTRRALSRQTPRRPAPVW